MYLAKFNGANIGLLATVLCIDHRPVSLLHFRLEHREFAPDLHLAFVRYQTRLQLMSRTFLLGEESLSPDAKNLVTS